MRRFIGGGPVPRAVAPLLILALLLLVVGAYVASSRWRAPSAPGQAVEETAPEAEPFTPTEVVTPELSPSPTVPSTVAPPGVLVTPTSPTGPALSPAVSPAPLETAPPVEVVEPPPVEKRVAIDDMPASGGGAAAAVAGAIVLTGVAGFARRRR